MAPKTLLSCPEEILRIIAEKLDFADHRKVCFVNKRLQAVVQPLLCSHIQWEYNKSQSPPIAQFLRTLIRRPDLAQCIKTIILEGDDGFGQRRGMYRVENDKKSQFTIDDNVALEEMVEWIEKLGSPYSKQWIHELRTGTMDAFVALLLCLAPGLRTLYLGSNYTQNSSLIGAVLHLALLDTSKAINLHSFEHLEEVTMLYHATEINTPSHTDTANAHDTLCLFYLPSIKKLSVSLDVPRSFTWPSDSPPSPTSLTSLKLYKIREEPLGHILSVTKSLRDLEWNCFYREDLEDKYITSTLDVGKISKALSHVGGTLIDLKIFASVANGVNPEPPKLGLTKPFGVFQHLHKLEKIQVSLPFLGGFSPLDLGEGHLEGALPRNIQWVTITDDLRYQDEWEWEDTDILEHLGRWLHQRTETTPFLRGLHLIITENDFGYWEPEMIRALKSLGSREKFHIKFTNRADQP
ncbi:hypothetical protein N7456_010255 [Penicillium angulare]|uniref:F-box domain-containing protein n=1 Tax=Penicillium angulare TaxID=116970 RepID=A0A9W9K612_9EURO|nr:hypothetical protein N7456_010255 [Penicillium angulare]